VTRAARWEWAFATEAIARGDLLLLFDDEAAAEHSVDPGDRLWLLPSWRGERPEAVKRSWWPEISRAAGAQPADGTVPVRCLCEIVTTRSLDEDTRRRLTPFHPWSPEGASTARRALLVRAEARPEPIELPCPATDAAYIELAAEPPPDGLLPALTDEGFALHRAPIERELESADAPRQ
jgi:Domain of unknown function (DUF1802)